MSPVVNVSRRGFLGTAGAGALVLAARVGTTPIPARFGSGGLAADGPFAPNLFVSIDAKGAVTIVAHRSEMGTGIRTTLPLTLADELEADWDRVTIEQAIGDKRLGDQNTDGSKSIRDFFQVVREAGATARTMLERAAAARWKSQPSDVRARKHEVVHLPSGKRLGFGELVADAAKLEAPGKADLKLKARKDWRYIGKPSKIVDLPAITTGAARFGADVRIDGMKFAMIERCPVHGGKVKEFDADAARAVQGVETVLELPRFKGIHGFQAVGGVAVVANSTWAAIQGRKELSITWDEGRNAAYDSASYEDELLETVNAPGSVVREAGETAAALEAAAKRHAADYYCPHLAHAPMEPPVATARFEDGACTVWAATQNPQAVQQTVAQALGIDESKVTTHVTLLGGGFGRKSKPDYCAEAALLSKMVGAPVQVVWTREDDIRHDFYHSVAAVHLEAGLDANGKAIAWLQRTAFPSIMSTFMPNQNKGSAMELGLGFLDLPYAIPNLRCEVGTAKPHVRIGWFRAVCNVYHAFAICSFADELAHAAGRDPVEYLLELIGDDRLVDVSEDGAQYMNYGKSIDEYPIDTGRLRNVVQLAAKRSGWGRELPKGRGLGVAVHRSFLSYIATVVEVEVSKAGTISIPNVYTAIDCGIAVNPDRIVSQMEGSAVMGASLAMTGSITAKKGAITQSNFHDFPVARINEAPRAIDVQIVTSDAPPAGVGEPGLPPFAPALCNALFAATGKRVRKLPLSKTDLSWG